MILDIIRIYQKIPFIIWVHHIMPYAYNTQPKGLLQDIRDYKESYDQIIQCNPGLDIYLNKRYFFTDLMYYIRSNNYNWKMRSLGYIWGKLTPFQRTDFFNTYILDR